MYQKWYCKDNEYLSLVGVGALEQNSVALLTNVGKTERQKERATVVNERLNNTREGQPYGCPSFDLR